MLRPYVMQRLLNQRARLKTASPESLPSFTPPPAWEPDSDEYDTDLEDEQSQEEKEKAASEKVKMDSGIGMFLYRKICAQISSPPQSTIMYNLASNEVNLQERQLGATNLTGLMCALLTNTKLTDLNLCNNHLGFEGGKEITAVLMANTFVTHLNLSGNGLGACGVSAFLAKLLRINRTMRNLNLSHNGFTDEDSKYLAAGIEANEYIAALDLSNNCINEEGAMYIGKSLAVNDTIEELDLSWNQIRRKGAVTICKAIKRNYSLKKLNLAWNGLCYEGALAVRDALKVNKHLLEIDISNNRINWEGASFIAEMLETNCYLEVLKVGYNPLTTTGCLDIIDSISRNSNSGLRLLDMTEVPVIKDFIYMAKKVHSERDFEFHYIHGEIVPHHDVLGERTEVIDDHIVNSDRDYYTVVCQMPNGEYVMELLETSGKPYTVVLVYARKIHPMQKIINYMYEKELRPLELLKSFDKEGKFVVSQEDFIERLKIKGIDIKSWEVPELLQYVTGQGYDGEAEGGMVNYKKLIESVTTQIDNERNFRINMRERSKSLKKLHDRIMNAPLPPLNVEGALVHMTGMRSADVERNPQSLAVKYLSESLVDRSTHSFDSKMAMARNIRLVDINAHATPNVSSIPMDKDEAELTRLLSPKPSSKVLMSSSLGNVKSRGSTARKSRHSKRK